MIAGSLAVVMPETHKKELPVTLDEGERFGIEPMDEGNNDESKSLK